VLVRRIETTNKQKHFIFEANVVSIRPPLARRATRPPADSKVSGS
jgi:hypothetical protein